MRQKIVLLFCGIMIILATFAGTREAFAADPSVLAGRGNNQDAAAREREKPASVAEIREIIVKYQPAARQGKKILSRESGIRAEKNYRPEFSVVQLSPEQSLEEVIAQYSRDPRIAYAEPNVQYRIQLSPDDPGYAQQWAMPRINAPAAWDRTQGSPDVVVAIVDTGIDINHPEFIGRLVSPYNAITKGELLANVQDNNGHGTHVAGIAAAAINNQAGIAGIAGQVKIMPVKALDAGGSGEASDVAEGIIWAANHGADVINLSLGGEDSQAMREAVEYAYQKGAVLVAAAGNEGRDSVLYPAALPHVIGVSATDETDGIYQDSNWGDGIDLSAPGVNIYSTLWQNGSTYGWKTGTSMAAAHVSGIAALVKSGHPDYGNARIEEAMEASAADPGPAGWDGKYGFGRVDADAALIAALPAGDGADDDNSRERARRILLGQPVSGTIAPIDDLDWFSVSVTMSNEIAVEIAPPPALDGVVKIYDDGGSLIDTVDYAGCGGTDSRIVSLPGPGRYYFQVYDFNSRWSLSPYTFQVSYPPSAGVWDLNKDGSISCADVLLVSQKYGTNEADLNGDGKTDLFDLVALSRHIP